MKGEILNIFIIALWLFFLLTGCNPKSDEIRIEREKSDAGYVYHFIKEDTILFDVGVYESGELNYLLNVPTDYIQTIFFHNGTGVIQSKIKTNPESLDEFGQAYYFYNPSGNLSATFNYVSGIKTGSAVTYHDSSDHIKEVMLYNNEGELYYRKTFDRQGNHIKTEGSKE